MRLENRLRDALERALAEARANLEPELRTIADELGAERAAALASAAQALDGADSLTGILQALLDAAAQHADRAGIFLVTDGRVRPWQLRGVDEAALSTAREPGHATFPLTVGGSMVAVLHVETDPAQHGHVGSLDLLARYAGRVLESMTLQTALGMAAR